MAYKSVVLLSIIVLGIAALFSFDCMAPTRNNVINTLRNLLPKTSDLNNGNQLRVYSKSELAKFKGEKGSKIYLAILGQVYDVTKGLRHYGPGGGYEFFAGIDGSRAFVSGKFDSEGLTDDITGLSNSDILGLEGWKSFYEKDYSHVGIVEGAFYTKDGQQTEMMQVYKNHLASANKEKTLIEEDQQLFPPCNSEWSQQNGGRVWCGKLSGGVQRDWEGVPRMYYSAGSSRPRCACVRETGPPSHDPDSQKHKNNGDLSNPNLNVYPGCDPSSHSCKLPDQ